MGFKVGEKRPENAGRKKGTPNKQTQSLMEIAERLEVNPFEVLLLFAKGDHEALGLKEYTLKQVGENVIDELTISPELRQKSAKDACEYLYPKRKAVEHSGSIDNNNTTLEQFIKQQSEKKN